MGKVNSNKASLREHISELRSRLLVVAVVFTVWCGVGYLLRDPLTRLLLSPLGQSLYYNTPQGGFEFFMRVVMTAGLICAVPVIVYQILRFVEPAVGEKLTKRLMRHTLIWSFMLALAGIVFGYVMILPTTLDFFGKFGAGNIKPLISADSYLTMVLGILATFAVIFQLPLIISITDHIRPIKPQQLTKYRRHVIVGSLAIALVLPFTYDPITQFIMAAPIIVLYELSIILVRWNHRKTRSRKREQRIAALVEAMHQAESQAKSEPMTSIVEPVHMASLESPRITAKTRPQVLDLRSAHYQK